MAGFSSTSGDINSQEERKHVALFEMSFKSHLFLVLYQPDSELSDSLATALENGAQRADLPHYLWQPFLDYVAEGPSQDGVDRAVVSLHRTVEEFLTE